MKATCSICGLVIRSRKSTKGTAKANLLKAIRKHMWSRHRNTMISRIKAGKRRSKNNPVNLEMIKAIQSGSREALETFKRLTEKQYQIVKKLMDALEPILPEETKTIWKFLEITHDTASR
ncbi:hypothetical protein ES705_42022 [subsurface metagenome]